MSMIKVYYFNGYCIEKDCMVQSKSMATRKTIAQLNFSPDMSSEKEVEKALLDDNGFYREPLLRFSVTR